MARAGANKSSASHKVFFLPPAESEETKGGKRRTAERKAERKAEIQGAENHAGIRFSGPVGKGEPCGNSRIGKREYWAAVQSHVL